MIISINGTPGSGKSTVAKILARKLKFKHYSTGDYLRRMAGERHMSFLEFSKLAETDRSIDEELDQWQANLGRDEDNFVIDAHLAFHFIPNSKKIFLNANLEEREKRILADTIRKESNVNLENTKQNLKIRIACEKKRWKEYYDLDPYDKSNFDTIIDTTDITPEEAADKVIEFVK